MAMAVSDDRLTALTDVLAEALEQAAALDKADDAVSERREATLTRTHTQRARARARGACDTHARMHARTHTHTHTLRTSYFPSPRSCALNACQPPRQHGASSMSPSVPATPPHHHPIKRHQLSDTAATVPVHRAKTTPQPASPYGCEVLAGRDMRAFNIAGGSFWHDGLGDLWGGRRVVNTGDTKGGRERAADVRRRCARFARRPRSLGASCRGASNTKSRDF